MTINELNDIPTIIYESIIPTLQDFASYLRAQLPYVHDLTKKNNLIIKLTQTQKIIDDFLKLKNKVNDLAIDRTWKRDIDLFNVLLTDQTVLRDYIKFMHSLCGAHNIPKDEYIPYEETLLNSFYNEIKTHSATTKILYTKEGKNNV